LPIENPKVVWYKESTLLYPPFFIAKKTIVVIQGTHIIHLIMLPFLILLLLILITISCAPAAGQTHPQNALPRTRDEMKSSEKKRKLPEIIPFIVSSIIR